MSVPVFIELPSGNKPDTKKFSQELEDPSMRTDMDGGYVVSRAKHTRKPRKTWGCGYTQINNTDKAALEAFWETVRGGSTIFQWANPQDEVTYMVRFKGPIRFVYVGVGLTQLWDADFTVEQA